MRAGRLRRREVGSGDIACAGGQGLVKLGGSLALAVDLVVAQVPQDIRNGHAAGGRLAVLAAAMAVKVRGRLAIVFELLSARAG